MSSTTGDQLQGRALPTLAPAGLPAVFAASAGLLAVTAVATAPRLRASDFAAARSTARQTAAASSG